MFACCSLAQARDLLNKAAYLFGFQVHAHVQLHVFCDRGVQAHPAILQRRQPVLWNVDLNRHKGCLSLYRGSCCLASSDIRRMIKKYFVWITRPVNYCDEEMQVWLLLCARCDVWV